MDSNDKTILHIKNKPGLSFKDILLANPYDYKSDLDKKMTEEIFRETLFVRPDKYYQMKETVLQVIENTENKQREIFLTGFSGCGKTTFLRWFINELSHDVNYQKYHFYYIDIFKIPTNDDHIIQDKAQKIENDLLQIQKSIDELLSEILSIDNDIKLDMLTMQNNYFDFIKEVFSQLQIPSSNSSIIRELHEICLSGKNCKVKLMEFSYKEKYLMLMLFFMFEMKVKNVFNEKFIIIFDNLDVLKAQYYNESIVAFIENCNENLEKIVNLPSLFGEDCNISYNYSFKSIFCLREANYEKISRHLLERKSNVNISFTVEFLFINDEEPKGCKDDYASFFSDYLMKRIEFAQTLGIKCEEDFISFIKEISQDNFIYILGRVFNYNFRNIINFFIFIKEYTCNSNPVLKDLIKEYNSMKEQPQSVRQGIKGMIYNLLIIHLINEYELDILLKSFEEGKRSFNEPGDYKTINVFRTIMTLILNWHFSNNPYNLSEYKSPRGYVGLSSIGKEMSTVVDEDQVIKCIRRLGHVQEEGYYYDPVSFIYIDITREDDDSIRSYLNGSKRTSLNTYEELEPPLMSINPSGFAYLKYIIPHFEWFSVRSSLYENSKFMPLFYHPLEPTKGNRFTYECTLEKVYKHVEWCISIIQSFYNEIYLGKKKFDNYGTFSNSKFAFKHYGERDENAEPSNTGKIYPIRIMDYHTSYLDSFRIFIMFEIEKNKQLDETEKTQLIQKHNKTILEAIEKYYRLFFKIYCKVSLDRSMDRKQLDDCKYYDKNLYPLEFKRYLDEYDIIQKIKNEGYLFDTKKPTYIRGNYEN